MLSKHIHGNIMYITIELQDLEDSKPILLKVACCMVLIWPFVFSIFYVGCDKTEQMKILDVVILLLSVVNAQSKYKYRSYTIGQMTICLEHYLVF
jgi:hypothetical protein